MQPQPLRAVEPSGCHGKIYDKGSLHLAEPSAGLKKLVGWVIYASMTTMRITPRRLLQPLLLPALGFQKSGLSQYFSHTPIRVRRHCLATLPKVFATLIWWQLPIFMHQHVNM